MSKKMSLRKWRRMHGVTNLDLATKLGISMGQLSKISNGAKAADKELLRGIREVTKGAVTAGSLVDPDYVARIKEMARERKGES